MGVILCALIGTGVTNVPSLARNRYIDTHARTPFHATTSLPRLRIHAYT